MQSIHNFGKSLFSSFTTAFYGPTPSSSRKQKQPALVSKKRPFIHEEHLSYSSPQGENRSYSPSKKSRKKSKASRAEGVASVCSSLAKPIEVEDSSAEEAEETSGGGIQLQEVVKASAMSETRVNCRAASFGNQAHEEDDCVSLGYRPWQATCLVLRSDTMPTRSPPLVELSRHEIVSLATWNIASSVRCRASTSSAL